MEEKCNTFQCAQITHNLDILKFTCDDKVDNQFLFGILVSEVEDKNKIRNQNNLNGPLEKDVKFIAMSELIMSLSTTHNVFLDYFVNKNIKLFQDGAYSYCNLSSYLQYANTVMIMQLIFLG